MSAEIRTLSIPAGSLPAPLIPAGVDVSSAEGCMVSLRDLRDSDWIRQLDFSERGVAVMLHMESMRGSPSGTLPDNDVLLASYIGLSVREVDLFRAMRDRVLQGWTRCSDGRLHHPDRARATLRIWIARLETRRKGATGNKARAPEGDFGIAAIEGDIIKAAEHLRAIDAQDEFLRNLDLRIAKWGAKPKKDPTPADDDAAGLSRDSRNTAVKAALAPCMQATKVAHSEAKRSESDSSSGVPPEDSRANPDADREIEQEGRSLNRTAAEDGKPPPGANWPADAVAQIRSRFPRSTRSQLWPEAEKVLDRLRKAGDVSFAAVLAGVERLAAKNTPPEYVPRPVKWLKGRGWEDEPDPHDPGSGGGPPSPGRPPRRNPDFQAAEKIISEYRHGRSPARDPFAS